MVRQFWIEHYQVLMSNKERYPFEHMFDLIGLERIPQDDIIPDGKNHLLYIIDPEAPKPMVAVNLSGSQWDLLWWIYRLNGQVPYSFDMFVIEFLTKLYERTFKDK